MYQIYQNLVQSMKKVELLPFSKLIRNKTEVRKTLSCLHNSVRYYLKKHSLNLGIYSEGKMQNMVKPTKCHEFNVEIRSGTFSHPEKCEQYTFGSQCIIPKDSLPPTFIVPTIQVTNTQSTLEECLSLLKTSHNMYLVGDTNKEIVPEKLFLIDLKKNGEIHVTLSQNATCQDQGTYIFESTYQHPNGNQAVINTLCINITTTREKRALQATDTICASIPEVTNTELSIYYTITYPPSEIKQWTIPIMTQPNCFTSNFVSQFWESVIFIDSGTQTTSTQLMATPYDFSSVQVYGDMPLVSYFAGDTGSLVLNTDFVKGNSFIDTQIVIKLHNYIDYISLPDPYGYTIVSINVLSGARVMSDIDAYLNQQKTQTLTLDTKAVTSITLFPQVKGGADPAAFTTITTSPAALTIYPRFGNQIQTYNSIVQVVYNDGTNENINVAINVKASYPHLLSAPNLLTSLQFGNSQNSQGLPKQVFSLYAINPTVSFEVYEKSTQAEVTQGPITYTSVGNTITYDCFTSNGIQGGKQYDLLIKLSENMGYSVYGPYTFDVATTKTPVFEDQLPSTLTFQKQQIAIDQLPNTYPSGTTISATLASGAVLPSNIMKLDSASRKMTYYFDQSTGGTASTFVLTFTLQAPSTAIRTYTQTVTFNDISFGVWFATSPTNIIAPIGDSTNYPIPQLMFGDGSPSIPPYTLNYPSSSITVAWDPTGPPPSLIITPDDGQSGIYPFQFVVFNTGTPNVYYNFTVTVPAVNSKPEFQPALANQIVILGFKQTYELPDMIDADSDLVTITVVSNTGWHFISFDALTQVNFNTGTLTIDATNTFFVSADTYSVVFELNDSKDIRQYTLNVQVNENTSPLFDTSTIPKISDFTWTSSDLPVEKLIPPAFDIDAGQTITVTATLLDGNPLPSFIQLQSLAGQYSLWIDQVQASQFGTYTVMVTASDSIASNDFTFAVIAKNTPPTITVLQSLTKVYSIDDVPIIEVFHLTSYFTKADIDVGDSPGFFFTNQVLPTWITLSNDNLLIDLACSLQPLGTTTIALLVQDLSQESSLAPVTATIILDQAPYYPDPSLLTQVLTCCGLEPLILPTPQDSSDTLAQIMVAINPIPPWLMVSISGNKVYTSQLATGSNPYTVMLTDSLKLSRTYSGEIILNYRPEWTAAVPVSTVTVTSGSGEVKVLEYGSVYSRDLDPTDILKVKIKMPIEGLPSGLALQEVNSTNITVQALSGFDVPAGNYKVQLILKDSNQAFSIDMKNLTINVLASPRPLTESISVNLGPPLFIFKTFKCKQAALLRKLSRLSVTLTPKTPGQYQSITSKLVVCTSSLNFATQHSPLPRGTPLMREPTKQLQFQKTVEDQSRGTASV